MQTQPGAPVPPENVIGRDELIARLWKKLLKQSVLLTAERRIGKTSIIRKMEAEALSSFIVYYRDLEAVKTAAEFTDIVFQDVERQLKPARKVASKTRKFLQYIGGAEFEGVKLPEFAAQHWKTTLTNAIEDLLDNTDKIVVFFWDELPWMMDAIGKNEGEDVAMELLDTLRALRQTYRNRLRMVFTGSIGLHHVLGSLKKQDYNNSPINDMYFCEVRPLARPDAIELARLLLQGESIHATPLDEVAETIATEVDNMAYYIQHVVDHLAMAPSPVTSQSAKEAVTRGITDIHDPWDLKHFQGRLRTYYEGEAALARQLLDEVAVNQPISFVDLHNAVQLPQATDAERVRELLALLGRDHYLTRRDDGNYEFRFSLIRRWWRLDRGL